MSEKIYKIASAFCISLIIFTLLAMIGANIYLNNKETDTNTAKVETTQVTTIPIDTTENAETSITTEVIDTTVVETIPKETEVTETVAPTEPDVQESEIEVTTTWPSGDTSYYDFDPHAVAPNGMTNRELLACVVYQEAGWSKSCDECRKRVVDVVLNRVESPYFPNTIYEVLMQKGQYGTYYWTGIQWSDNAEMDPAGVDRAFRVVDAVLCGANSDIYGQDYVWQAEFTQGSTGFWCCGTYYGAM